MKRNQSDFAEYFAHPRQRPAELDRARMQLKGLAKCGPQGGSDAYADAVLSELRAMRSEMASLREAVMQLSPTPVNDVILTRKQTADLLGWTVETVTKRCREDGLPHTRWGKEYRMLRSRVMAWQAENEELLGRQGSREA